MGVQARRTRVCERCHRDLGTTTAGLWSPAEGVALTRHSGQRGHRYLRAALRRHHMARDALVIKDLLLPGSDGAVAIQLAATALVGPLALWLLIRRGQRDVAWLVGGVLMLWLAFTGFRSLH